MKKYELDSEQEALLNRSYLMAIDKDGWQMRFEYINEAVLQLTKKMMSVTPKSKEQTLAIQKLKEAQFWLTESIRKSE